MIRHRPVIDYEGTFRFALGADELWSAMSRTEDFEDWWSWLHEFRVDGEGLQAGAVLHGVVAPPVPYRMRVSVEIVNCRRPDRIDAWVHGDLEGTARLTMREEDDETLVDVAWTIEMMQRPMRLASRVAHPVLKWGHDRVVDMTVQGFRSQVERAAGIR